MNSDLAEMGGADLFIGDVDLMKYLVELGCESGEDEIGLDGLLI